MASSTAASAAAAEDCSRLSCDPAAGRSPMRGWAASASRQSSGPTRPTPGQPPRAAVGPRPGGQHRLDPGRRPARPEQHCRTTWSGDMPARTAPARAARRGSASRAPAAGRPRRRGAPTTAPSARYGLRQREVVRLVRLQPHPGQQTQPRTVAGSAVSRSHEPGALPRNSRVSTTTRWIEPSPASRTTPSRGQARADAGSPSPRP